MTATAPVAHRAGTAVLGPGRLLRLELRHNAMLWLLPVAVGLFWYNGYREIVALPPMWNLRAMTLQNRLLLDLTIPVTAAAAWMGSREDRPNQAQLAVIAASVRPGSVWLSPSGDDPGAQGPVSRPLLAPGSPAALAAHRFAALTPAAKHAWLAHHLAALQAGRISLAQLP